MIHWTSEDSDSIYTTSNNVISVLQMPAFIALTNNNLDSTWPKAPPS